MKLRLSYDFGERLREVRERRNCLMEELVDSVSHSKDFVLELQKMTFRKMSKQRVPVPADEPLMVERISVGSPSFFMCVTGTEDGEYLHYENAHFLKWITFEDVKSGIKSLDRLYERLFPRDTTKEIAGAIVNDVFNKDRKVVSYVWSHGPLEGADIGRGEDISYRYYHHIVSHSREPRVGLFSRLFPSLSKGPEREIYSKNCVLLNYWETNNTFTARDIARKPVAIEWYGEK